ncbi:MAG: hypothetical protein I3273_04625 [Candidatus Moeniiplasma glomeromycotorum]|nr:hypothetical protein [Candidatus Moeniiplasma glomeromycotorum]MCE8169380.1 hypothetical protein [Candidatus Moeniiplasma glomeromycotorum]
MTCIHSNCSCLDNKIAEVYRLQTDVSNLHVQVSVFNSQLAEKQCQISAVQTQLEHMQQQMTTTIIQLNESQGQVDNLSNQLEELRLENNEKTIKLKCKDDEIQALKRNLEETQKGFLGEKLHSKQEKLENFATELGIELSKIQNLCKRYRNLILSREENRGNDIAIAKENIEATKEGLIERGINADKVQKICKKCKQVAQLEVWIERIKEQYEAKQEIPV